VHIAWIAGLRGGLLGTVAGRAAFIAAIIGFGVGVLGVVYCAQSASRLHAEATAVHSSWQESIVDCEEQRAQHRDWGACESADSWRGFYYRTRGSAEREVANAWRWLFLALGWPVAVCAAFFAGRWVVTGALQRRDVT